MRPAIFIPEKIARCGLDLLRGECDLVAPWREGKRLQNAELRTLLYRADAVIIRLFEIGGDDIARCENLKVIGRHGVGVDNVDCHAASARQIPVVYTPHANANAVAEHAVALMMALARQIGPASRAVIDGRFQDRTRYEGVELADKTLGVIGLGRIGQRVARMAAAGLSMKVRAYDPVIDQGSYTGPAVIENSLETVMRQSDFLSLHVPLNPQTEKMINDRTLHMLKPDCRIINTSRGAVIDESALLKALDNGTVAGAALDVYENEPLPGDHPLCGAPNTLLTPHISSSTREALDNMARDAAQGVLDVLQGRRPQYVVNPEALSSTAS